MLCAPVRPLQEATVHCSDRSSRLSNCSFVSVLYGRLVLDGIWLSGGGVILSILRRSALGAVVARDVAPLGVPNPLMRPRLMLGAFDFVKCCRRVEYIECQRLKMCYPSADPS